MLRRWSSVRSRVGCSAGSASARCSSALLETARDGHGAVLVVHGDPGVGKTALLEYAVEAGEDFRVVRTAGVEGEMELDYAALQQLCSPILEFIERLPDPQRDALGVAFGLQRRTARRARSSSGSRFSGSSPKLPSSSRSCAWSTTRSGSTARRAERSRSSRAACWPSGSRSCSRRVTSGHGLARLPAAPRRAAGPSGCAGAAGVRTRGAAGRVRARADRRRDGRESARAAGAPARADARPARRRIRPAGRAAAVHRDRAELHAAAGAAPARRAAAAARWRRQNRSATPRFCGARRSSSGSRRRPRTPSSRRAC